VASSAQRSRHRQRIYTDFEEGLSLEERIKLFDESKLSGEKDRLIIWAGVGTGFINTISPAADILQSVHEEAVATLRSVSGLLQ